MPTPSDRDSPSGRKPRHGEADPASGLWWHAWWYNPRRRRMLLIGLAVYVLVGSITTGIVTALVVA